MIISEDIETRVEITEIEIAEKANLSDNHKLMKIVFDAVGHCGAVKLLEGVKSFLYGKEFEESELTTDTVRYKVWNVQSINVTKKVRKFIEDEDSYIITALVYVQENKKGE